MPRAGVPLHAVFPSELAPERLQAALAALASVPLVGVTLPLNMSELPADSLSGILSALAGSAPTMAALHGVPIVEELLASQLPASVQELTQVGVPFDEGDPPGTLRHICCL